MLKKNLVLLVLVCYQITFAQFDIDIKTVEGLELKGKVKSMEILHATRLTELWLDSSEVDSTLRKYYLERYDFSEDGNQIYYSLHDAHGICKSRVEISYHSSGIVSGLTRNYNDEVIEEYQTSIDSYGNLIEYQWLSKGLIRERATITYNVKKGIVKTTFFDNKGYVGFSVIRFGTNNLPIYSKDIRKGQSTNITRFFYDEKNNLVREYDKYSESNYQYNSNGQLTKAALYDRTNVTTYYNTNGILVRSLERNFDEKGNVVRVIKTDYGKVIESSEFFYDTSNVLSHATIYYEHINLIKYYNYDTDGNMTHEIHQRTLENDSIKILSESIYAFDVEGNWITKTEFIGPIVDSLSEKTIRNISYY